jgi:hypothetical protein
MSEKKDAYNAGFACAVEGPNAQNCNIRWFANKELNAEWERGKRDGQARR